MSRKRTGESICGVWVAEEEVFVLMLRKGFVLSEMGSETDFL